MKRTITIAIIAALTHIACAKADRADIGPTVVFTDSETGSEYGCYVDFIKCGEQSCEIEVEDICPADLDDCLTGTFFADSDDEEGSPVLGCSPDGRYMDVDKEGVSK